MGIINKCSLAYTHTHTRGLAHRTDVMMLRACVCVCVCVYMCCMQATCTQQTYTIECTIPQYNCSVVLAAYDAVILSPHSLERAKSIPFVRKKKLNANPLAGVLHNWSQKSPNKKTFVARLVYVRRLLAFKKGPHMSTYLYIISIIDKTNTTTMLFDFCLSNFSCFFFKYSVRLSLSSPSLLLF